MPKLIFVNLPVADLPRSVAFYEAVGAVRNPQFSDDTAACMVVSETISVMLLTHDKFGQFTPRPIADAHAATEVLLCVSCDSREAVDTFAEAALAHAGAEPRGPQDHGFMYGRSIADPDGHIWEPMWMDMAALGDRPAGEAVAEAAA
jgi:predicted lactoylglutathione lyase